MVCTVDHLASVAGVRLLADGGNAVDAAVAASAALAVTTQNMCGMGGDLWALVHDGSALPHALNASGRAGSGADPAQLRAEGRATMPFRNDIRSVPIPGCVDGWLALHQTHGRAPLAEVLAPAIDLADNGFPVAPILSQAIPQIAFLDGAGDYLIGGRSAASPGRCGPSWPKVVGAGTRASSARVCFGWAGAGSSRLTWPDPRPTGWSR
jgi:gamma-glutamyltranspeptidase/glutathione hydrolase